MLQEVKNALEVDSEVLTELLPYIESTMYSVKKITMIKNDPSQATDSLYPHLQEVFAFGTTISFNKSPYKTLESGGLDRISNPEIRNKLSKLYGFTMSNSESWLNEVLRVELFKKKELFSEIFGLQVEPGEGNSILTKVKLNNPGIIYNNPQFDLLLSTSGWALPHTFELISSLNEQMISLINEIDLELKNK
jgi:hypothetical protein